MFEYVNGKRERWLYKSPTGTGKSLMAIQYLIESNRSIFVTPRIQIIAGMLSRIEGMYTSTMSLDEIVECGQQCRMYTPVRLRNILASSGLSAYPDSIVIDECHHSPADTYKLIDMFLNGVPRIGLTATPFRGTPKGTQAFLDEWPNVYTVLTLQDAIARGVWRLPECTIWPLVDDDTIDVSNGEFSVQSTTHVVNNSLDLVAETCVQLLDSAGKWDKATVFALPSSDAVECAVKAFEKHRVPVVSVTQKTNHFDRIKAFQAVEERRAALLQIDVVSEGVDLRISRVIDIRPTMSPVKFFQQAGRIRVVDDVEPEYVCCCRNLERHCYLFDGLIPCSTVAEVQTAFDDANGFPKPSKRSGVRVIGLEEFGRFKATPVQLSNGVTVFTYHLVHTENNKRVEYYSIVHPAHPQPIYGRKVSTNDGEQMQWGKWELCERLPELKGCVSAKPKEMSEKQRNLWQRSAADFGLDVHREIGTREFQLLPFLLNTRVRLV